MPPSNKPSSPPLLTGLTQPSPRDYGFGDPAAFEAWRKDEYPALQGETYLDYAAAPPAPKTPVQRFATSLGSTLLTNPHSRSTAGASTSSLIDSTRARVLTELFGVKEDQLDRWDVVFTAGGATQGIKLVGEAWKWEDEREMEGRPGLSYLVESHTSLVGLRGTALSRSSSVATHRSPTSLLRSALSRSALSSKSRHPTLYTYAAQCNATGARLGLRFCTQIKQADPNAVVLVDSAAYSATSVLDLGSVNEREAPDFVVASAYKIFGWPTSLGFLIVKRSSAHLLAHSAYFGGGTISSLSLTSPFTHTSRSSPLPSAPTFPPSAVPLAPQTIHETLEHGTPPYLEIAALSHALDWLKEVTHGEGLAAIGRHAAALSGTAERALSGLRHATVEAGGEGAEVFVRHMAFSQPIEEEYGKELPEHLRVVLEPPGPTLGFTLLAPSSACSPASLASSSFPLSSTSPQVEDYRPHLVGHAHLSRLAVINGISLRTGGMCNTGVWAGAFGVEDEELRELERRGRRCWDDEEFSPLPPHRPLGLTRVSFGLASTVADVEALVDFVKRFFVRTEEVAALERGEMSQTSERGEEVRRAGLRKARVKELYIYPIKSCAAQPLSLTPSATLSSAGQGWPLTPSGLAHDRALMLVSASTGRALSQKRYPRMALIRPRVEREEGRLVVEADGMETLVLPLTDSAAFSCSPPAKPATAPLLPSTPPLTDSDSDDPDPRHLFPIVHSSSSSFSAKPTLLCGSSVSSIRISATADAWFTRFLNPPTSSFPSSSSPAGPGPGPVELRRLPPGHSRHTHSDGSAPGATAVPLPLRLSNESPFLLVSEESVREVNRRIASSAAADGGGTAKQVDATAFRPNLVVGAGDEGGLEPFWEDEAGVIKVGSSGGGEGGTFVPLGGCRRCLMVAVDQKTGLKTAEPLATLSRFRTSPTSGRVEFGVHLHLRDGEAKPDEEEEESATYLLDAASTPSPSFGGRTAPAAAGEQGHSDAIWATKWARTVGGGEVVVTAGADRTLKTWDPSNPSLPTRTIRPPKSLGVVGLDVDKSDQGASFFVSSTLDSVINRWSIDGQQEGRKELGPADSWDISLHPRTDVLATAGQEGRVRVMSAGAEGFGEELAAMEAAGSFGTAVEYSKSGSLLAVASETGYVTLFDAETGSLISSFPAHSAPIRSLSFTSNLLVTGSDDKRINVFDLRALTSTNGTAAGGRRGQVASLGGHDGWVVSVEARNERLLASGSSDGTIKLFDLSAPSAALSTLRDHTGDVWALAWAPEAAGAAPAVEGLGGAAAGLGGGRLVSAGEDGRVRFWRGGG
ncbi:hypothetical protein JCM8097_001326 [Rhodosporidiobolus ruineniae]